MGGGDKDSTMKRSSGFTLIELAIVLVIIGLLLGGVLKGQELINNARVKNLAADFRNVPVFIYGYQDRYRALPGDDTNANTHVGGVVATTPAGTLANGQINGAWDSNTQTDESILFWQHVRLARLAAGPTAAPAAGGVAAFVPTNSVGGRMGVSSVPPITGMLGSYYVCSAGIEAQFALQIDTTLDDGVTTTGAVQTVLTAAAPAVVGAADAIAANTIGQYTVCMAF